MVDLTRAVRFCVSEAPLSGTGPDAHNTFAAHPSMRGLGRFYELEVTCRGPVDPASGYFLNIKTIDQAVRAAVVPQIAEACLHRPAAEPLEMLPLLLQALQAPLSNRVRTLRWKLTPYYSIEMTADSTNHVLLRQQFEFAASHRLHCPGLSDDENRRLFGKCNHPGGHGHNYRVEPCIEMPTPGPNAPPALSLGELERLTDQLIIERYDHKHLNDDTPEFATHGGVNPSVENIAKICYERLAPAIRETARGQARLHSVTVWETDKTSCRYPV